MLSKKIHQTQAQTYTLKMIPIWVKGDVKIEYVREADRLNIFKGGGWVHVSIPAFDVLIGIWDSHKYYRNKCRNYENVTVLQNESEFSISRLYDGIALTYRSPNFQRIITLDQQDMDALNDSYVDISAKLLFHQKNCCNDKDGRPESPEWENKPPKTDKPRPRKYATRRVHTHDMLEHTKAIGEK